MSKVYMYVVDRDFGFAPNPFHGYCTLATCKPKIRKRSTVGDWIIGMGGSTLQATGRCIFVMQVSEKLTFNQYFEDSRFYDKKPVRAGSRRMLVGDNIYYYDACRQIWQQSDSHHSNADGSVEMHNLKTDTSANSVLISQKFFYFGKSAPDLPPDLLLDIRYKNPRDYRVFDTTECVNILTWFYTSYPNHMNTVMDDPFDFYRSEKRYSGEANKIQ